jgi:ABC-2 type transport system permease protein
MIDTLRGLMFGTHIGHSAITAIAWATAIGALGVVWSIRAWGRERPDRPS